MTHRAVIAAIALSCGVVSAGPVRADDASVGFDRPGIAFGTQVLPRGGLAWEQGLPDARWNREGGVHTRTWVADTLLRLGISETLELQLGADSYGGVRQRGDGLHSSRNSIGDGWVSLKWVPTTGSDTFSFGVLATAALPYGQAPLGGGITWAATPRLQFDASFLRGLDAAGPDWQAGVGMAMYFAPAR